MQTISERGKPLYIYLQRPDDGNWIVVGRYRNTGAAGEFIYAPSYVDAGLQWPIDPVNLPFIPALPYAAQRYNGLHDVLRDASPDAWGQMLIRRRRGLGEHATPLDFLVHAGNGDRWGALAVGSTPRPSVAGLAVPRLPMLPELVEELHAIAAHLPPVHQQIRKHLFATPSMGGARPKTTIRDGSAYWLVKPGLMTDTVDLALLEHATQSWGRAAGMDFAETAHHPAAGSRSVVRVRRFDRHGERRRMTVSAASLLQVEYPFTTGEDVTGASYPRLAEVLKHIGAPIDDQRELFRRMVFNAVVGNDDDHPRNHAVVYHHDEARWRLTPAFDVVPNPDETPASLVMQLSTGRRDISRAALLGNHQRFGLSTVAAAGQELDAQLDRIHDTAGILKDLLDADLRAMMEGRLDASLRSLRKS